MKKRNQLNIYLAIVLFTIFVLWTVLLCFVDVKPIGPKGSKVGFSTINSFVRDVVGVNMLLYTVTDWLGIIPIVIAFGFACYGLVQLIKTKSFFKVDKSILLLGYFYVVVAVVYVFFEMITINYSPILINGKLEVSYPSSTTMLVLCIMPTALMQLSSRIKNNKLKKSLAIMIVGFSLFMVLGRFFSGVHWFSDIIGGILISASLVSIYRFFD